MRQNNRDGWVRFGVAARLGALTLLCAVWPLSISPVSAATANSKDSAWTFVAQENTLVAIQSQGVSSDQFIRLAFEKSIGNNVRLFSTVDPPRVIVDLPKVKYTGVPVSQLPLSGDVRNIELVESENKTRLILNLKKFSKTDLVSQGNDLLVRIKGSNPQKLLAATPDKPSVDKPAIDNAQPPKPDAPEEPVLSKLQESTAQGLTAMDFRRGKEGEGRLILNFSGADILPDFRIEGGQLTLDLKGSTVPDALLKVMDVADFGTPVKTITTKRSPSGIKIQIQASGYWEHASIQEDRRLLVDLKPLSTDPLKSNLLSKAKQYKGEKISLNFQNVEIRALLQVFAEFTNLNIVVADSITGTVTLKIKNVPWDQAFDLILRSRGLDMRQTGDVLLVAPADEIARRETADLTAKTQLSDLEPLRIESFPLNYQKADEVLALITNERQRLLSKRGSAVRDVRTNQLFVQDIPSQLDLIRRIIAKLDVPVRQVMIEARVVVAESTFASSLGAKLGYVDLRGVNGGSGTGSRVPGTNIFGTVGGTQGAVTSTTGQGGAPAFPPTGSTNLVNLPAPSIVGNAASSIALSLFNSNLTQFINLELSALEVEGGGKVISSPRVITADQVKALIEQGTEIPYSTSSGLGTSSVTFRKANLKLEVTPQITPDGGVILDVDITKDTKGEVVVGGISIDTKHVQTKVLVDNGGTVVIGGIFEVEEKDSTAKTPFFGDLPVVGHLFKQTTKNNKKTELMVFLTPRVLSSNTNR